MELLRYVDAFGCLLQGSGCKGEYHVCVKVTYIAPCKGGRYWQTRDAIEYGGSRGATVSLEHLLNHRDKVIVFQLVWEPYRMWKEIKTISDVVRRKKTAYNRYTNLYEEIDELRGEEFYIIPANKVFNEMQSNKFDWDSLVKN